jgi:DnaK suppressor protein
MAVKKKAVKARTATKKKPAPARKTVKKVAAKKATVKKKVASKKSPAASKPAAAAAKKTAAAPKRAAKKTAPASSRAVKKTAPARNRPAKKPGTQIGPVPGIAPYAERKGEEYMNDHQVEHFRNILLTWKRGLMEEVDRTVHHMQDDAANFPDPNDRATQESEFSMELRARDRERKLIKKIDESIRHLDDNEFGYCEACGVEIGVKRLEARPTATLCIDCKILDEIREKQMG